VLRNHGRYPYVPIVGRPVYNWPNGTRLAFYVAINVEVFPYAEGLAPDLNPRQSEPDIPNYSWRDWGNRVGIWRLFDLFDEFGIALTANFNTAIYDECPPIADALRARGAFTLPTTIELELATNPFLRAEDPDVQKAVGLPGADPAAVFAELRERKNKA